MARDDEGKQPIIVKKKKKGHAEHHGGSWKVAYADFVTSMMAFFLVMWLIAQSESVKMNIAGYFQDPTGFKKGGSSSITPNKGTTIIPMKENNATMKERDRREREQEMRRKLKEAATEIRKQLQQTPAYMRFKDQIDVEMTAEGLRIQLVETSGQPFFEVGSAELLPNTKLLLRMIGEELGKVDNRIIIEGHTDNLQYADNASYTNWELSADRANSARRWMKENGLNPNQLTEVRGYAETQPRIRDNPSDPQNRRIAIIVVNDFSGMNFLDKNVVLDEKEIAQSDDEPASAEPVASSE